MEYDSNIIQESKLPQPSQGTSNYSQLNYSTSPCLLSTTFPSTHAQGQKAPQEHPPIGQLSALSTGGVYRITNRTCTPHVRRILRHDGVSDSVAHCAAHNIAMSRRFDAIVRRFWSYKLTQYSTAL